MISLYLDSINEYSWLLSSR